MIFVTVGVSQPFDRLIKEIDKRYRNIPLKIFCQIGRTHYEPLNVPFKRFLSPAEFENYIEKAGIVITHGGFGSIFNALEKNKPVISVPKTFELDETDNDQTDLVKLLEKRKRLIGVYNIRHLEKTILEFDFIPKEYEPNLSISRDIDRNIKEWFANKC